LTLDKKKIGRTEVGKTVIQVKEPVQPKTAEESMETEEEDETEEDEPETSKTKKFRAKEMPSIEEIKEWDTKALVNFLQKQNLSLYLDFEVFYAQEITGKIFLELTKQDLQSCGLKFGPAKEIAELIEELKEKKRKASSSYHSLKEVLKKHGIEGSSIGNLSQFTPGK
jgi:hypothetical protein